MIGDVWKGACLEGKDLQVKDFSCYPSFSKIDFQKFKMMNV